MAPRYMESDAMDAFFARMMRRERRSLSAGEPPWVGQLTSEAMDAFFAGQIRGRVARRLPAAQPVGASAVGEQASATVGGSGGRTSPVSPASSRGTIDLGLDDERRGTPVCSTVGGSPPPGSPVSPWGGESTFIDQEQPTTAHDPGTPKRGPPAGSNPFSYAQFMARPRGSVQFPTSSQRWDSFSGGEHPSC
jgi:hypothetical protein